LVTDGITESRNTVGELYSEDHLIKFIEELNPNEDSIDQIQKEIFSYTGGEMDDDISVIAVKVL